MLLHGKTTRENAIKLETAIRDRMHFVAIIEGEPYVITSRTWVPITGSSLGQCVAAEQTSFQSIEYRDTRKATPEEQALIEKVIWQPA